MNTHIVYWDKQSKDFGIHVDTVEEFVGYLDENNENDVLVNEILDGNRSALEIDDLNSVTKMVDFEPFKSELEAYKFAFELATE